ncbi:glycosyl hydrolase family 28 protein [Trinickia acidisoli]|uniref:glycosyl hydrolase family 28 protein n=1 Tax=Trinickia acidisoli TaxID=2767482 RepID=UPI001A8CFB2E|nr:glycosyl hydrolase family 28 protein [Trinickia acidisoli]
MIRSPQKTVAASLLALLLAACGSGSSSNPGDSASAYPDTTPAAVPYQVGLNPTDKSLQPYQPAQPAAPLAACQLSAKYYASGSPAIPTYALGGTTNVDVTLADGDSTLGVPAWSTSTTWTANSTTVPTVLGLGTKSGATEVALATNGLNVPDGYPTAPDTARIQAALYACATAANAYDNKNDIATNTVVELSKGANGQTAYVTGPLTMPGGVTLEIDQGVTLFASRDPVLYESATAYKASSYSSPDGALYGTPSGTQQGANTYVVGTGGAQSATLTPTSYGYGDDPSSAGAGSGGSGPTYFCGQIYPNDDGCNALISNVVYTGPASKPSKVYTSNNAVVGPGVIDGQGGQPLFSLLAGQTLSTPAGNYLFPPLLTRSDGTAMSWWDLGWEGNEALTGEDQNNPRIVWPQFGYNFTLYNVTLQNAPKIHISPTGINGFVAWNLKVFTPTNDYTQKQNYWGAYYDYATVKNTDGFDPGNKGATSSSTPTAPALAGNYANDTSGNSLGSFNGDVSNIVMAYSYISDSDDNVAIKGESSSDGPCGLDGSSGGSGCVDTPNGTGTGYSKVDGAVYNLIFAHDHFFYGHGLSIGSQTSGGPAIGMPSATVMAQTAPMTYTTGTTAYQANGDWSATNQTYATQTLYPSVSNISVYDLSLDYTDNGIRIKTDWGQGGLVSNINYTNVCMQGNPSPSTYDASPQNAIYIFSSYDVGPNQGVLPSYQNINVNGVHELSAANWTLTGFNSADLATPAAIAAGWTGAPATAVVNPLGITLNNLVADQAPVSAVQASDANITLGNNVSGNLGLMALNGSNNVKVAASNAFSPAATVNCSQAFADLPGNTDANGNAIGSPFPGQVWPESISGQQVPAQQ